jgi:phage terminase large subunit-like protein
MKGDDIVNEDNSNNEETREKIKDRYDNVSANLPCEWAFRDHLGTRYFGDDWYGGRLDDMRKYADTNSLKFVSRAAWTVRPGFEQVPIKQLQEHMVDLYFPEKLTFRSLISKCRQNEKQFRCQLLNEPAADDVAIDFDEDVLKEHVIVSTKVPRPAVGPRRIVCCWDTAHTDKLASDYSAGAVGYCHEEKRSLYVLEIVSGKWKDSDLAKQVVDLHFRYNPFCSELEKFPSWELMAAEIQRYAFRKYGRTIALSWREVDNSPNAKRNRVKGLESLLSDDRLWFVEGDWLDLTFQQFIRFTGLSRKRKDDIPDAISFLQRLVPYEQYEDEDAVQETPEQRKEREKQEMIDKFQNRHRDSAYTVIFQAPAPPPAPEPVSAPVDPGPARIFGDTGIHL